MFLKNMIKAVNLTKTYFQGKADVAAVKKVNLEIFRKEAVLITGPSGAGKSTLLHLLGGLDRPTKGAILFDNVDFYSLRDSARSKIRNEKIGFVFQFYHLLQEFTLLENVMLPALVRRKKIFRNKKDIKNRAEGLIETVGLKERMNHRPAELSGGESQRVALARALINFPEILFCDEPTGNLDSETSKEVMKNLWLLKEKEGMALVIVTHDSGIKGDFSKRLVIKDGKLEEFINEHQGLS